MGQVYEKLMRCYEDVRKRTAFVPKVPHAPRSVRQEQDLRPHQLQQPDGQHHIADEAIAANHMGMKICGVSCISNLAAGMSEHPLSHREVQEAADMAAPAFKRLVTGAVKGCCRPDRCRPPSSAAPRPPYNGSRAYRPCPLPPMPPSPGLQCLEELLPHGFGGSSIQ